MAQKTSWLPSRSALEMEHMEAEYLEIDAPGKVFSYPQGDE